MFNAANDAPTKEYGRQLWIAGSCLALSLFLIASAIAAARGPEGAQQGENFFTLADRNHDGYVTAGEFRAAMASLLAGRATADQAQLAAALDNAFPARVVESMLAGNGPQNQTPKPEDVAHMEAALPSQAPAKPLHPRKVLVLSKAAGFVHSCIPLAAKTVQELGEKTGAWTATVTYDAADINAENLQGYDLVFLNNTTGAFLDDPDPAVTAARRKALLDFVRSGKGLAGIHAAGDSYHEAAAGSPGLGTTLAPMLLSAADTDKDKKVTAGEMAHFSDELYNNMDTAKTGKVSVPELRSKLLFAIFTSAAGNGAVALPAEGRPGRDPQHGTWPEFNSMIGCYFKFHWLDPTHIVYKIDDPDTPLTAMFRGSEFAVDDETYTFSAGSWSRKNLHVLTSIDYARMSDADKRKEDYPREDHDYGLSWIRREGQGRVFYQAHGHDEKVYAIKPILEHLLAGMQYALGDLKADDSPGK